MRNVKFKSSIYKYNNLLLWIQSGLTICHDDRKPSRIFAQQFCSLQPRFCLENSLSLTGLITSLLHRVLNVLVFVFLIKLFAHAAERCESVGVLKTKPIRP